MNSSPHEMFARARNAQRAWANQAIAQRCTCLRRLRREIAHQSETIAATIAHEANKTFGDALSGDVLVTLEQIRYYEQNAADILHPRSTSKPPLFFRGTRFEVHQEPHGVVLIFGPSNYPFQISVIPLITALAAGNAVILKCSERTPQTAALIANLCTKAGFPQDLIQVIHTTPEESAALIDARPDFIFFTGSSHNGRQIAERAAKLLIPTLLELGGKDAALIFADCNQKRAVEGITYGAFSNTGRVCLGIKRAYVEASIYSDFLTHLKERIAKLNISTNTDADLCAPSSAEQAKLHEIVADAIQHGATLEYPQDPTQLTGPIVLTNVPDQARALAEETFGPILCLASFRDEAEAIRLANSSPFSLGSSIWTSNRKRARCIAAQLTTGTCAINDVIRIVANPYAPFGGNGLSGHGRYHGPEGLLAFSHTRTLMLSGDRRTSEIGWFPFSHNIRRLLTTIIRLRHGAKGLLAWLSDLLPLILLCALLRH